MNTPLRQSTLVVKKSVESQVIELKGGSSSSDSNGRRMIIGIVGNMHNNVDESVKQMSSNSFACGLNKHPLSNLNISNKNPSLMITRTSLPANLALKSGGDELPQVVQLDSKMRQTDYNNTQASLDRMFKQMEDISPLVVQNQDSKNDAATDETPQLKLSEPQQHVMQQIEIEKSQQSEEVADFDYFPQVSTLNGDHGGFLNPSL